MIIEYKGHKPDIHESCFIAENATVIGRVKINKNSSIWFGTVVRGDGNYITIGETPIYRITAPSILIVISLP